MQSFTLSDERIKAARRENIEMIRSVATFLMFQDGAAEEAMNFCVSLCKGSETIRIERHCPGEQGTEGSIKKANLKLVDMI
jgi:predicted 3-demethylubiquinone-9 3-methyltransferase (glyoxalase superfamily)